MLKKVIYSCIFILFMCLLMACRLYANPLEEGARIKVNINRGWLFSKDSSFKKNRVINIPHTWNVTDVMDDEPGYYRGVGWYKKTIAVSSLFRSKEAFIYFDGANQETEVFVNGKKVGQHVGGYTAFCMSISQYLLFDDHGNQNEILIKVDNRFNENIPPLTADFTFYGGIYRDVFLVATNNVHFSMLDNASSGVYISTPSVSAAVASMNIKGTCINYSSKERQLKIVTELNDAKGKNVAHTMSVLDAGVHMQNTFDQQINAIDSPHLWSPDDPYLYSVTTRIIDAVTNLTLDEMQQSIGFKWFVFDADQGFFLNGQHLKLIGMARHQDFFGIGNAVPHSVAVADVKLIKEAGGNFLRVSHYPQDQAVLDACDQLGILTSVEIPVVNEITESENFYRNCKNMQVEMIRQNYNHASIIIWCYMNEVLLKAHFANDKSRQKIYFSNITALAKSLDSITRNEDPYRYTMIANHADFNRYNETGLTTIPMLVGWNLYSGWYGGNLTDLATFLSRHHTNLPKQPMMITEYGADADPRIRSAEPVRFDKSLEYAVTFHQYYLSQIIEKPYVAGGAVWNLADFNSETREETMPHINNKGLVSWNRTPKDPYFLYQALLSKTPYIKIASRGWTTRAGVADSGERYSSQLLMVATNMDSIAFTLNGKVIGNFAAVQNIARCSIPFVNGKNNIHVSWLKNGKIFEDKVIINFDLKSYKAKDNLLPLQNINILLGAKRLFINDKATSTWLPDQPYYVGGWGSIGGRSYKMEGATRTPYGTDKNILDTDNDPIYQSQQIGIQQYRLDVKNGRYELTLHFAELQGAVVKSLPYNLADAVVTDQKVHRVFDVFVNGKMVVKQLDITKEVGVARVLTKKIIVSTTNDSGLTIDFRAIEGEPVLNALQLKRMN